MFKKSFMIGLGLLWTLGSLLAGEVELTIVRSVRVSFPTDPETRYRILTSTDVDSGEWVALGNPFKGTGDVYTFSQDLTSPDRTFFKVEEVTGDHDPVFDEFTIAGLEMVMVSIPSGTFLMGSPEGEEGRSDDEGPQTAVTISQPFWISKYEVTQGQYLELMGNNPSNYKILGLNAPVESVSWENTAVFCLRLTERERAAGNLSDDFEYRLPTEAQWEYACRAGTTTRFSFGDDESELGSYAWFGWQSFKGGIPTYPVGKNLPNPWGLYDMHGNVWEFCWDRYTAQGYSGGILTDPVVVPRAGARHIRRGGSGGDSSSACRSARRGNEPASTFLLVGFRPVLVSVDHPRIPVGSR